MPIEEAETLLHMPKKFVLEDSIIDTFNMHLGNKIDNRYNLRSLDGNILFLFKISQGKHKLKITLHVQENNRYIGLFRIDYNASTHKNPPELNPYVPEYLKPYLGKIIEGSHVHVHVQGYRPLNWAIPIDKSPIIQQKLENSSDFDIALHEFCDIINLQTKIILEGRLFL